LLVMPGRKNFFGYGFRDDEEPLARIPCGFPVRGRLAGLLTFGRSNGTKLVHKSAPSRALQSLAPAMAF
jgi:hypothetical protein